MRVLVYGGARSGAAAAERLRERGDEVVTAGTDALSDGAVVRAQRNVDPYTGAVTTTAPGGPAR
jgi:NAD(P)-dependent dehydrogenase (short-subunit alcohol dehydrogenase family)